MSTDADQRLGRLGSQIDEARRNHLVKPMGEPLARQPLTTVFDDWNEESRKRDLDSGRRPIEQRIGAIALLLIIGALLIWW